ncbi:MAG TPA: isoleucine--tRNA ligase [Bacillota bacterium]|nr:isoleucine--tRNA ligase [Bacillota bacterium]HOG52425.1 isoleucine--tRNA ligase [Bacillota bacterium]
MFRKISSEVNFPALDGKILEFWKQNGIFEKSLELRKGNPRFVYYEGPPTANGRPHPGHVLTRAIKDVILRFKTMEGYLVDRKGGWDTHGLPVELEVEKQLGISGKPEIEKYGVEKFISRCKESVWKYLKEWTELTDRIGFWLDMEDAYVTYKDEYIESEWWAIKTIFEKGLIYKGHKVVPYCPRCGTALSSHEVAQGYKDVTDNSVYVKMEKKGEKDTYFLVWTTTPWTLPSNVALAVAADADYSFVKHGEETLILSSELIEKLGLCPSCVTKSVKGSELVGSEYEPLYRFVETDKPAYRVIKGDFVTMTDGTGIVHIAPAFGEDDSRVGKENDLPVIQVVDLQGRFDENVTPWKGVFVKEADPRITEELASRGLLFKQEEYLHSYPFCWRCDTPLLYYARSSWFISMSKLRENLLKNNSRINWFPEHIKDGRFGNFLENVIDWAVSRERYWGTPLPIWVCDECGNQHAIGSRGELKELAVGEFTLPELHRPYIDAVKIRCPKCGGTARRTPEVLDCWFDSGSMPFAQWHYPFENREVFEYSFPADFITEAIDQTRGWFYTLVAISTLLFDEEPFRNCLVMGLVLDEQGQKMSKSKGNVVDTWGILDRQGADAMRWYLFTVNPPWNPTRFYEEGITEAVRRYLSTLWNVYSFFVLYANIDNYDPREHYVPVSERSEIDRWIISKLNNTAGYIRTAMESFDITGAGRSLEVLVDQLSNWYVRRSRRRYWGSEWTLDKESAFITLYEVLVEISKLTAPFTPFIAEEMYSNLVSSLKNALGPESVHLCDYPVRDERLVDEELERKMDLAEEVVYLGRLARNTVNIKNRQPLSKIIVESSDDQVKADLMHLSDLVKDELNVKEIGFLDDLSSYASYKVKPRFDLLGKKLGPKMKAVAALLASDNGELASKAVENKSMVLEVEGEQVEIAASEVIVETIQKEGWCVVSQKGRKLALSTEVTEDLELEGFLRELLNRVQNSRKEAGFQIEDRIRTSVSGGDKTAKVLDRFREYIKGETLSDELTDKAFDAEYSKEWEVNDEKVTISISRVR